MACEHPLAEAARYSLTAAATSRWTPPSPFSRNTAKLHMPAGCPRSLARLYHAAASFRFLATPAPTSWRIPRAFSSCPYGDIVKSREMARSISAHRQTSDIAREG
jgi:hypothetical protein